MIAIRTNVSDFEKQLASALAVLEVKMSIKYYAFTLKVFKSVVMTSPQWSGNLASNWNYSINSPDTSYSEISEKSGSAMKFFKSFQVGADPAVSRALRKASVGPVPSWRVPVYITNATPTDQMTGSLVQDMADGYVKLRPVNMVPAQGAIISFTLEKFKGASL